MKIVVLMGSPNKKGSTAVLVDHFKRGAEESGHEVEVIDVCHADVAGVAWPSFLSRLFSAAAVTWFCRKASNPVS